MNLDDMTATRRLYGTKLKRNARILIGAFMTRMNEAEEILDKPTEICSADLDAILAILRDSKLDFEALVEFLEEHNS